jgi:hypothetical protein
MALRNRVVGGMNEAGFNKQEGFIGLGGVGSTDFLAKREGMVSNKSIEELHQDLRAKTNALSSMGFDTDFLSKAGVGEALSASFAGDAKTQNSINDILKSGMTPTAMARALKTHGVDVEPSQIPGFISARKTMGKDKAGSKTALDSFFKSTSAADQKIMSDNLKGLAKSVNTDGSTSDSLIGVQSAYTKLSKEGFANGGMEGFTKANEDYASEIDRLMKGSPEDKKKAKELIVRGGAAGEAYQQRGLTRKGLQKANGIEEILKAAGMDDTTENRGLIKDLTKDGKLDAAGVDQLAKGKNARNALSSAAGGAAVASTENRLISSLDKLDKSLSLSTTVIAALAKGDSAAAAKLIKEAADSATKGQ